MNTKLEELKAKVAEIQKEIKQLEVEENKYLNLNNNEFWYIGQKWHSEELVVEDLQIRTGGFYANKGFFLSDRFNWEIIKDSSDVLVLLPTRK